MKNLLLTLGLFLYSNTNAMQTDKDQEMISAILFTVNVNPPVQIIQVPSQKKVKFEDQVGRRIKVIIENSNRTPIYSSIYINYDTPPDIIVAFLSKFFDASIIECQRCNMSFDTYYELFPTVSSVTKKWSKVFWEKVTSSVSFFDD
jgi:hypothetical protein